MPYSAPRPTPSPPSATATSRRLLAKGEWPGSATAATMKGPVLRASSRAGSRSSVTGCASTATRPGPPRSPSRPRSSIECSTLDARTPSASPDQQWGMGAPLPLPPPCNTLAHRLVGEHEAPDQEHLGQIPQAQLVAQPPEDHEEHDVGWDLDPVQRRTSSLVEPPPALP